MKNLVGFLIALLVSMPFLATSATEKSLIERLQPLVNGSGQFELTAFDHTGAAVQRSSGNFAVMQPGKFYWQTLLPYEQLLVSDAESIWLYDPDLEQVTVKPFSAEQDQLPIRILSGEFDLLQSDFTVSSEHDQGTATYYLKPINADGSILSIELTFEEQDLTSMTVTDSSEAGTHFKFSQRKALSRSDKNKFIFVVPEGADVFHDQ